MYTYKDTETDLVIETYHERDPMGDGDKKTVSVLVGIWNNYFENSPEIILDVGACVGIYSLLLERMIKNDNCKIIKNLNQFKSLNLLFNKILLILYATFLINFNHFY